MLRYGNNPRYQCNNLQRVDDSQDKVMERWECRLILRDPVGLVLQATSKMKRTRLKYRDTAVHSLHEYASQYHRLVSSPTHCFLVEEAKQ